MEIGNERNATCLACRFGSVSVRCALGIRHDGENAMNPYESPTHCEDEQEGDYTTAWLVWVAFIGTFVWCAITELLQ
jgi:hypothetical protein